MTNKTKSFCWIDLVSKLYYFLVIVALLLFGYSYLNNNANHEPIEPMAFEYPENSVKFCSGLSGISADHSAHTSEEKIHFNITTPANYRADYPHPLLLVWAPSGFSESQTESFIGVTKSATAQGFIVAHVRSVPLSMTSIKALGEVPSFIINRWCVDPSLVFYTGHSDGATVSNALAVFPGARIRPRAIAPSALGMQGVDMADYVCPSPTAIMLMHNKGDKHFPGFGREVADWWASCNKCSASTRSSDRNGCVEYVDCHTDAKTLFCEAEGSHYYWPGEEFNPIGFFSEFL